MKIRPHVLGIILSLGVLFTTSFSQTATPTPKPLSSEGEEIKIDSRLVVIPVSVTDPAGNPVTNLGKRDFNVVEEGRRQEVDNVGNADTVPLEIALLFDVSASTDSMFKFQQETAAKFLQDVLKPTDRATIFTIGAEPTLVAARDTADKAIVSVRSIEPTKQFTAFYDSVAAAAQYLARNAPSGTRRVIVVISDGEDTNSSRIAKAIQDGYKKAGSKINELDNKALYQLTVNNRNEASLKERVRIMRSLQDADTVFYSINPAGSSYQLNKMSLFGQENMEKFAGETGGTAFLPKFLPIDTKDTLMNSGNMKRNAATLETIFRQLANELRAQYLVQYYSDAEYPGGRFVKLNVTLANPGGNKLRARQGYYVKD
ncbi:MAG: VWA domain-containing protein [Pyrinomonadaceae bacterium]